MNVHPIFVHFPVALLTLYSVMELLQFRKLNELPAWVYIKSAFLIIGTAGLFAALQTGDMAKHLIHDPSTRQLISAHEFFAKATTAVFCILTANYVVYFLNEWWSAKVPLKLQRFWSLIIAARKGLFRPAILWILAAFGLVLLTITGALGGTIVYGPTTDPIVKLVNSFLFKQ